LAYVGNSPALKYTSFAVQHFTTSATTSYTLDHAVNNENDIRLVINNVVQQPGSSYAYTATGTTLTLSAATAGTDTMYCVFLGKAVQTVNPGAGSVGADELSANAITGHSALGEAPADTDEFLVSDSGTLKRVDYSYVKSSVVNRPNAQPIVINGNMQVNQKGTVTGVATNTYVIDRWTTEGDDCTLTISKDTDVPTGEGFGSSQKLDVTSANGSVSAGDVQVISTRFEGQNLQLFKKGTSNAEKFTVSFWVKSTTTGTFILHLQDDDNSRHCSIAYTISSGSTWEKKVLTLPADTTGAFGDDANRSLRVQWYIDAGSDYTSGTLATTWASNTTANRAVGQTTGWTTSTSNNFWITGVQLEVGEYTSATLPPFQHESYGDNLRRCLRYFEKRCNVTEALVTPAQCVSGTKAMAGLHCTEKRIAPSVALGACILLTATNVVLGQ